MASARAQTESPMIAFIPQPSDASFRSVAHDAARATACIGLLWPVPTVCGRTRYTQRLGVYPPNHKFPSDQTPPNPAKASSGLARYPVPYFRFPSPSDSALRARISRTAESHKEFNMHSLYKVYILYLLLMANIKNDRQNKAPLVRRII